MHHVGSFPVLEDQICAFTSDLIGHASAFCRPPDPAGGNGSGLVNTSDVVDWMPTSMQKGTANSCGMASLVWASQTNRVKNPVLDPGR